jgi:hypothetical protein
MTSKNLVRPSRDGDQFHYLWAARRCLLLLHPLTDLVAITIEGSSPAETRGQVPLDGEDVIDVAEYHGDQSLTKATGVRYRQLKHSTRHAEEPWTASGLEKTLIGFSDRYKSLLKDFPSEDVAKRFSFHFVTNRPVSQAILETIDDAAKDQQSRHPKELQKLERFTGLSGAALSSFCQLLHFDERQEALWDQRNILFQASSGYLPDADVDAPTQLKELVTRKALSESEGNPAITKVDVLRALKTDETRLYPAELLIQLPPDFVPREQEAELVEAIVRAGGNPVIVHAEAGVGKSMLSCRIGPGLPSGSKAILYDCYGNGLYRSGTGYRHRHQDALVQISNELARAGLCHPLIPTANADASDYMKAFRYRLQQAVQILRADAADAILCVIVDAADNAQMAAEDLGQARSFARDLIRLPLPDGVRLVLLCRSHRRVMLDPPPATICRELLPFSRSETAAYLRKKFSDSSEQDVDEFHRLTSHNPRVQALALSRGLPLQETLRLLGPNPTTVESAIGELLAGAIANLRDSVGLIEKTRVDQICVGLATLRPLIPIQVLAQMSGVPEGAIRSFALDLGRPLLVSGDTIQFLDEPVETWFREQYKPSPAEMGSFIATLTPLAAKSAYVASTLPQLMLEAGNFSELVSLALNSMALPDGSPLERRDVELQRLQFALKASLRSKRYLDAVKLSLKAGGETAGDDRQRKMIQSNTDLSAKFLGLDLIQELVSRRSFGSQWVGSHHAYEAGLLSGRTELVGDARSRLRMAGEWLRNWSQLSADERRNETVSFEDIAELATAHLNVHGIAAAVANIGGWKPPETSFRVGRLVVSRLIDHGRRQAVNDIAAATVGKDLCLALATVSELTEIHEAPPASTTAAIFAQVAGLRRKLKYGQWDGEATVLSTIVDLVEAGLKTGSCTQPAALDLIERYLPEKPPRGLSSRFSNTCGPYLRAYCVRAALSGQTLQLNELAHPELRDELEKKNRHHSSQDLQEFEQQIGTLLPWHQLRAEAILGGHKDTLLPKLALAVQQATKATEGYHRNDGRLEDEVALLWFDILFRIGATDDKSLAAFCDWVGSRKRPLFTPTLTAIARLGSRNTQTTALALDFASKAYKLTQDERADADSKSSSYVSISRSVLFASPDEAKAYFNEAVEVASKIGDENLARWDAILDLAEHAAKPDRPAPEIAYRLSRCAELSYDYVARDKHFDWRATVRSLAALCPTSCLSIMSRWRDRRFGRTARILPIAIVHLVELGHLSALDALPLLAIDAEWKQPKLLEVVLSACGTASERAACAKWFLRYAKLQGHSSSDWTSIRDTLAKHKISTLGLGDCIAAAQRGESLSKRKQRDDDLATKSSIIDPAADWDAIFGSHDVSTVEGLSKSHVAFRSSPAPRFADSFFAEAFRRVAPGREAALIEAARQIPAFELYELRNLLEQLPSTLRGRPAVVQSLEQTLKAFCRRFCMGITKNRHYEVLPLRLACELANIKEADAVEVVLDAIGQSGDLPSSGRLFSLAALLTFKLSNDEALQGLEYGLSLFDAVLEDKDGDGPWRSDLSPPSDIHEALARYLYVYLASPAADDRWAAAHAVVGFCALGREKVLAKLCEAAAANNGGAFIDARLPFYKLHALQWLLIAFSRAALDTPKVLASHMSAIMSWALDKQDHVRIRAFAARTAQSLAEAGAATIEATVLERLKNINKSPLTPIESKSYRRVEEQDDDEESAERDEEDKFHFGIDFGPYWLAPLGRVFAISQRRAELKALEVIRGELEYSDKGAWDEDPRQTKKLYGRRQTYASHSSYPSADTHQFYLWYHSMMIAAGKLLKSLPVHFEADSETRDEFADWLRRHNLTRNDGRWLFDRRDPIPLDTPAWRQEAKDSSWLEFREEDFLHAWRSSNDHCVWGYWTIRDGSRRETVTVRSALVSPATSMALLRALASSDSTHSYQIPSAGHDEEIDDDAFVMKGWVTDHGLDSEIDAKDPWSGDVRFPAPAPARSIVEQFTLTPDVDERNWTDTTGKVVMSSLAWGSAPIDDEGEPPDDGSKLLASRTFVQDMLSRNARDLIILVHLERRRQYQRHESRENDDDKPRNATRIYLLRADDGNAKC